MFNLFLMLFSVGLYLYWVHTALKRGLFFTHPKRVRRMDLVLAGLSITAYMVWSPLPWAFTLLLIPTYVVIVAWVARAMTGVVYIEHHWRMALYTSAVCNVIALTLALA